MSSLKIHAVCWRKRKRVQIFAADSGFAIRRESRKSPTRHVRFEQFGNESFDGQFRLCRGLLKFEPEWLGNRGTTPHAECLGWHLPQVCHSVDDGQYTCYNEVFPLSAERNKGETSGNKKGPVNRKHWPQAKQKKDLSKTISQFSADFSVRYVARSSE